MSQQDPTADYKKYPKQPNFLIVVICFAAAILIVLASLLFFVNHKEKKMPNSKPEPTPNALIRPAATPQAA